MAPCADDCFRGAECERRKITWIKPLGAVGIVAGPQNAGDDFGVEYDYKIRAARVLATRDDVNDARRMDGEAGFLQAFALGRPARIFAGVDEAGGQGPLAAVRFVDAAHKQDTPILAKQNGHGYLGIREVHPAALRTCGTKLAEVYGRG